MIKEVRARDGRRCPARWVGTRLFFAFGLALAMGAVMRSYEMSLIVLGLTVLLITPDEVYLADITTRRVREVLCTGVPGPTLGVAVAPPARGRDASKRGMTKAGCPATTR